jgi:hypothetical protein
MPRRDPAVRFFEKVRVDPDTGCWLWTAATTPQGYAWFNADGSGPVYGHRWIYEQLVGPIPAELELDHLCRVRCCVNPEHLEAVTHGENSLRGESPSAHNAQKTHCVRGHAFDEANTYIAANGWRGCRTCHREDMAAANASGRRVVPRPATHCANGHPWDEANTHIRRNGARSCRACHRDSEARRKQRRLAA